MQRIRILVVVATLALASGLALAQTGSIQGTVTDKSGAVVQGAEVTARNLETNALRTVATNSTGGYSLTNLPVAPYEVSATKQGFKTFKVPSVTLTVAQVLTVDAVLEPGAVSEEVQVRADEVPGVDLETSQVSNIVDSRKMTDLPLLTRDPYSLILLSPGTIQSNSGLGGFSVNGSRERDNNFLLDGSDNNDTSVPGIAGGLASLNPDATEEFRVITNNFMPEYGRNNGAIIDIVTKSGTNTWHGGARYFGRWNALGARDYFNHNPDVNDPNKVEPMNPYVRNQFGFNIGGPIVKNKTFFFVDSEWQRFRTTLTNTSVVPNAAFKSMFNGGTFPYTDYDPNDCPGGTAPCTLQIDAGGANSNLGLGVDPLTKQILSLYPDPNGPAVDQFRGNLFYPSTSKFDARNITAKIDHHFTDNEVLTIHGAYDQLKDPDAFHDDFLPGIGATATQSHVLLAGATLTSTLRPTLVNEVKMGFNKNDNPFTCGNTNVLNVGSVDQYGRSRDFSLPDIAGFGCLPLGDSNGQWRKTGTWSIGESLSWVKGPHTFKFGADYRRVYENGYDSFTSRSLVTLAPFSNIGLSTVSVNPALPPCDPFGFLGGPANANDPYQNCGELNDGFQGTPDATPDNVFQDMANVVVGLMDSEQQSQFFDKAGTRTANDSRQFRQHEYNFYFQDSWKIRQSLTINIGLRYQFNGVPYETGNNLSNLFQNASGPAPAVDPANCGGSTPCNGFTFSLVGPGTGHLLYNNDFTNFEPRLGFAWDPFKDGKTSIRGAFGTFHDRVFGNLFGNARGNPPFQQTPFTRPLDQPENVPLPGTVATSPVILDGSFFFPIIISQHYPLPYTASWNFGVQRELLRDLTIDVNYVGNRGFHQLREVDGNPPQPDLVAQLLADGFSPSSLTFTNLWAGAEFGIFPFDPVNNNAFFQASLNESIGNSWYHGLQLNVNKRFAHGFQIQGAYTFSHAIDDSSDPLVPGEKTNRSFPRNSFALYNERGNSAFDIRHRLVVNYAWELPFGKGRAYLNGGFLGRVLEGWQLSGITTLQSGHPYELFGNRDSEHTGLSSRLDIIGNPALPAGHPRNQTGVNIDAFALAPYGQAGTVAKNRFYGPGYNNWDMVMSKDISIVEQVKLQFRTEVYNVFNRTQFDQPGDLIQSPGTFGFSTATLSRADGTTSARQLQFGLKLMF
jgi:Carboxypeptidase regulatory-like domain